MKKNKIIMTLMLILMQYNASAQTPGSFTITNYTEKYKHSIYAMTRHDGKWYVTTAEVIKKGKAFTDIYTTDAKLSSITPFAKAIMTTLDDGTPAFDGNTMYYTSVYKDFTGKEDAGSKRLKIAMAISDGSTWKEGTEFPHNSPDYRTAHPTISDDGSMLVFVSDMPGGKGGMDLYYCMKDGNTWLQPQNITNLNTTGNELFPVFDNDGNLFFSSNVPGGLGGLDLFTAKQNAEGFDNPVRLQAPLNSEYDDFYLFSENGLKSGYISSNRFGKHTKDDVLYFEQTGTGRQTGLTVKVLDKYTGTPLPYVSVTIKDKLGEIFHKGLTDPKGLLVLDEIPAGSYTVQGMLNDVSTTIAKINESDFSGNGILKELTHNDPRFTLAGIALNTRTGAPLEGVLVTCKNKSSGATKEQGTDAEGKFLFQLEQNSDFEVQGSKPGWLSSEVAEKTTRGLDRSAQLYVDLKLQVEQPHRNGTITLKKIYYDYNKCDIRTDAARELNRVVKLLNDYPDMAIELSSHTDSRGGNEYNMSLSQCRADAAVKYLLNQGINKDRLVPKGYGETRLLNGCNDATTCTDKEHEQNRRTEFTILSCASCTE